MPPRSADFAGLLQRIIQQEESALAELHQSTLLQLRAVAFRFVADPWHVEEVMQDVYSDIWTNAGRYDANRGTPLAWLCMITRSRAVDSLRRNRRRASEMPLNEELEVAASGRPDHFYSEKWRTAFIRKLISALPISEQELIQMSFFEGCSHSQIANRTGLPLGTIKSRLRKAISSLRRSLRCPMHAV